MTTNTPFYTLKDDEGKFQRGPVPLLPIFFDRVMERHPPTSASALFNLPVVILGLILEFMDPSSLASLALVNSDCRQLARSRQFADVRLDYSDSSEALVRVLESETSERMKNGSTSRPSLGACIRRLTVSIDIDILRQRFGLPKTHFDGNEGFGLALIEAGQPEWQAIFTTINEVYLPLVQAIICSTKTLPHLEILDWEEDHNLSEDFYNALARSSIRHLKLYHPIINTVFEISLLQSQVWPLLTLHLELTRDLRMKETTATLCASILRLCAPSLDTLVWVHRDRQDYQTFGDGPLPKFPCLRNLHVKKLQLADGSIMDAFLKSKLVNLNIELKTSLVNEALDNCGQIPTLKALSMKQPPLSFLQANTQLSKVDFDDGGFSSESLEVQVLPILSTFSNLTSLRVSWPTSCSLLPETGLCLIGSLHSLYQLCISCGRQKDYLRSWAVDHRAIRQHLSPLRYLQRLALCGDTYSLRIDPQNLEEYYIHTLATEEDLGYTDVLLDRVPSNARGLMLDPKLGKPYWEKRHQKKMMIEVKEYIDVFPSLEWIYIGERAVCVQINNGPGKSRGVVSINELVNKRSYLSSMFGIS